MVWGLEMNWSALKFALLAGGWAALAAANETASITDPAAFYRTIAAVRADANSYDKFKEPVATNLIGKSFAITMPLQDGGEGRGIAFYDYDGGKLILDVSPKNAWPFLAGPKEALPVLILSDNTETTGSFIGQNAFGVTAEVTNFRNQGAGIAIVDSPKPMLSPMSARIGANLLNDSDWWVALDLPPSEAKALAINTVAVVQGAYATLPSGSVGFCDKGISTATIDKPSNYSSEKCYIGARISRIALIDKRTSKVLKEWTTATDPILGPDLWAGVRVGMNKHQLKAVQATMTDYGSFEANGLKAMVEMQKGLASKVRVWIGGPPDKHAVAAMTQRHGQPVMAKCFVTTCEAKWRVNAEVDAYLSISGQLTYQLSSDAPPIGFR